MANALTTRNAHEIPTAERPLPMTASPRGLALLMSLEAAEAAMADPNDRAAMATVRDELSASLIPATAEQIAGHIEGLAVMYPQQARSDADHRVWVRAWLADLCEYPPDVIEAGCVAWRRSPERFMPTPGQLRDKMDRIMVFRRAMLRRAEALFDGRGCASKARGAA